MTEEATVHVRPRTAVADVSRNVLRDHGTTAIVTRHAADVAGNVITGQGGDESCRRWTR